MKYLFIFCFLFCQSSFSQSFENYQAYTKRITAFSKPAKVLSKNIDADGTGSVEFTNAKKQVVRFRIYKKKLQILHGGIAFQLFTYKENNLQNIQTFDVDGHLAGEREANNEAITAFIIEKPALYRAKKKLIDDAEGNIDLKDDSEQKIIRVQMYDTNSLPIREFQPTYISSQAYWNYNVRMY